MKVEEPDLTGTYGYADYLTWQLPEMVELIRGKIFKMSHAPSSKHQKVSGKLYLRIGNYLEEKNASYSLRHLMFVCHFHQSKSQTKKLRP